MPITINGTGSIGGLSAGGLPDASVVTADLADGAATTPKIPDNAITAPKLDGNQSGSAPIYAARAWVNFNGTGTVAIRASGNVSSITDGGVGTYTVNFTTAMANASYAATCNSRISSSTSVLTANNSSAAVTFSAGSLLMHTGQTNSNGLQDHEFVSVSIFQ